MMFKIKEDDMGNNTDRLPTLSTKGIMHSRSSYSKKVTKNVVILKKMLSFVTETAAVQAQEQRAKDAKSFRRLNASDLK